MKVLSLPGDPGIGPGLADRLGLEHVPVFAKRFPDGEMYLRLTRGVERERVLVVQSMYPAQNDRLLELLLALELLNRYESEPVLLVTYLAYARQDKEFLEYEAISLRSVLRAVTAQGVRVLVTVDAHNPQAVEEFLSGVSYVNVFPGEVFAEAISREYGGREMTVIAPDRGAGARALSLAEHLGCGYVVVQKFRDRTTGQVRHSLDSLDDVRGLAVIVDDIISTGGTIAGIASHLSGRGVETVVAASHALLVGDALERLVKSGVRKVYSLPTVPQRFSGVVYLDLVPYLAGELEKRGIA